MEEYPEELRTPPVPLVALVGSSDLHAAISLYLHREQPPLNTLALPDFAKVPMIGGNERKPVDARMPPPLGILKADWLSKHRTRMPAVLAVLFDKDQVYGDPTQWMQVCTHLDNIKTVIRGRSIKLVVAIVQPTTQGDVNEERLTSLRKRAEVDARCCIMFVTHEPSELKKSMARLGSIMGELATAYYKEEGRRVKLRIEKKSYSSLELSVRYNFKVAVYAEFRRDWVAALKSYETAYSLLQEVITNTSMGLQPVQRVVEMKCVAEQLHFKISTLLLHSGKEIEAVRWFREHALWYKQMLGPLEGAFLHWAWVSKQFQVFAELLQTSSSTASQAPSAAASLPGQPSVTQRELQPAYYYHVAAVYMVHRRRAFEAALLTFEAFEDTNAVDVLAGPREEVGLPIYIGQAPRLLKRGNDNHAQSPTGAEYMRHMILVERTFRHPHVAIELLTKAHDQFKVMEAGRTIYLLGSEMAREYFAARDYTNAKRIFNSVAAVYREEGWIPLLGSALTYLRECARRLGLVKEFIQYGLELIALPLPLTIINGYVSGSEVGPFGQLERNDFQVEIIEFLRGEREVFSQEGQPAMAVTSEPVHLEIDVVSPLRVVLSACVAFHDQTVKPGKPTSLTLCLLTHLPLPVSLDEIEVLFNKSSCNFSLQRSDTMDEARVPPEGASSTARPIQDLELVPRTWKKITVDVASVESGKLECLGLVARLGPHTTIRCQVESPNAREDIPFWNAEPGVDAPPLANPTLAYYGQKVIQVEEPEALVDIVLDATSPGLVGEAFPVQITIQSTGHTVQAGDLEVYFAPTGTTGASRMSSSPPTLPASPTQAELLLPVGITPLDTTKGKDSYVKFTGLVEVPEIRGGESWSTVIYVRWLEPKAVTLMTTFVYQSTDEGQPGYQYRLHKSECIDCEEALAVGHRYMAPFRRDALLLGSLEASSTSHKSPAALALKESSILVVTMKNTCSLPIRLFTVSIQDEDVTRCLVGTSGGQDIDNDRPTIARDGDFEGDSSEGVILAPEELFTQLFWVHPLVATRALSVGTVCVTWQRVLASSSILSTEVSTSQNLRIDPVTRRVQLSKILVESPPLVVTLDCPPHAVLGKPFTICVKIQNLTNTLQEVSFTIVDTTSFIFSGAHSDTVSILPKETHCLSYRLVPISSGMQQLPQLRLTSAWYSAGFQPSSLSTQLFVFPSTPSLNPLDSRRTSLDEAFSSLAITQTN